MARRTVTIDLRQLTDAPWAAGDTVKFILQRNSYVATATYPASSVAVALNNQGRASTDLWCNAEGLKPARYVCELPSGESFPFTLPAGAGAISVEGLRGLETEPYTPSSAVLFQALLEAQLDALLTLKAPLDFSRAGNSGLLAVLMANGFL